MSPIEKALQLFDCRLWLARRETDRAAAFRSACELAAHELAKAGAA